MSCRAQAVCVIIEAAVHPSFLSCLVVSHHTQLNRELKKRKAGGDLFFCVCVRFLCINCKLQPVRLVTFCHIWLDGVGNDCRSDGCKHVKHRLKINVMIQNLCALCQRLNSPTSTQLF